MQLLVLDMCACKNTACVQRKQLAAYRLEDTDAVRAQLPRFKACRTSALRGRAREVITRVQALTQKLCGCKGAACADVAKQLASTNTDLSRDAIRWPKARMRVPEADHQRLWDVLSQAVRCGGRVGLGIEAIDPAGFPVRKMQGYADRICK